MKRTGQSEKSFHFSTVGIKNYFHNHVMVGKPSFYKYFSHFDGETETCKKQLLMLQFHSANSANSVVTNVRLLNHISYHSYCR